MTSHVKGVKHMKKELALQEERDRKLMNGEISRREAEAQILSVVPIPNPPATKQKVRFKIIEIADSTFSRFRSGCTTK